MKYREFWKKVKRTLALLVALTLFVNGWSNYDMSAHATQSLENTELKETEETDGTEDSEEPVLAEESKEAEEVKTEENAENIEETEETKTGENAENVEKAADEEEKKTEETGKDAQKTQEFTDAENTEETVEEESETTAETEKADAEDAVETDGEEAGTISLVSEKADIELNPTNAEFDDQAHTAEEIADDSQVSIEGNSYVSGNYSGTVTVRPKEAGWTIGTGETGSFQEALTYDSGLEEETVLYLKDADGKIKQYTLHPFVIDKTAPAIESGNISVLEGESVWTQKKTVQVNVSEEVYELYYSDTVTALETMTSDTDKSGLNAADLSDGLGSFTVTEAGTYYIFAVDKAGNVGAASVLVSRIDGEAPILTGLEKGVYYLSEERISVDFNVGDGEDSSGIEKVICADGEGNETELLSSGGTYSLTETGDCTVKAVDKTGNETSAKVTVKKDTMAPSVRISSVVNDAGYTAKTAKEVYLFRNNLKVTLEITDEPGDGETDRAPITVIRTDESGSQTEIEPNQNLEYVDTLTGEGSYTYSVMDEAGNEGQIFPVIQAEKIIKNTLAGTIFFGTSPVEIAEDTTVFCFGDGMEISFLADFAADENIVEIAYSADGGDSYTSVYSKRNEDGSCTLGAALNGEALKFGDDTVLPLSDGSYSYIFKVTDAVGTIKTYSFDFKVDKTAPDSEVYVVYDSDVHGSTEVDSFSGSAEKKVFGQNQVDYYLLVKDQEPEGVDDPYISGISAQNLIIAAENNSIAVSQPDLCENTYAVADGTVYSEYTVFKGSLTIPDGSDPASVFDSLKITKLSDRAGNAAEAESTALSGDTVIFIDNCSPKLGIDYGTPGSYAEKVLNGTIHYQDTAVLTLTLDEDFYKEQTENGYIVQPYVVLTRTVNGREETFTDLDWETVENEDFEARLKLELPSEKGEEAVYHFTVTYHDGSGNALNAAEDLMGELKEGTFTSASIVVDNNAPKVTEVHIKEDADDLNQEENKILTKNNVTITAVVEDAFLDSVILLKDGENSGITPNTAPDENGKYFWEISADAYLKGSYQVEAYDIAGNKTTSEELSVEIDKTAPQIAEDGICTDTKAWADEHGGWVNSDTTFTITVENDNGSSAEPHIRYRKQDADTIWEAAEGTEEENGKWSFKVSEQDDTFSGNYEFQVYDALENGKKDNENWVEFAFQKDKVKPDVSTIQAEYVDVNIENNKLERGPFAKALESIRKTEFGKKLYERLFVKKGIQVTLYIQDEISGVEEITCQYGGKTYDSVKADGSLKDGTDTYDVVRFNLDGENADLLKIISIKDKAGNMAEADDTELEVVEGTSLLVIDETAPRLSVSDKGCVGKEENNQRRYYSPTEGLDYEEVRLTFTEKYLDKYVDMKSGAVILPEVTVYRNGEIGKLSDYLAEETFWNFEAWNCSEGTIQAVLHLPYSTADGGEEIEYVITASYQDGSGNMLMLEPDTDSFGTIEEGTDTYRSGTLILDNRAPELIAYEITGTADRQVDDVDVYHNVDGDDVNVTFTIEDNENYWDQDAVRISVVDVTNKKIIASSHPKLLGGNEIQNLVWANQEDHHTASFGFDGEEEKEANYEVRISYADRAANQMITDTVPDGVLTDGAYTSEPFILDHVAPIFNISFSKAFRLTDSRNQDYKGSEKTPVANMTSYYGQAQGKVDIKVAIDETYLAADEEKANGIADFSFNINGTDTAMKWEKAGTVYTGTYSITSDGDYQVSVSYKDAAANNMTGGNTVQGGTVADGAYASPLLILDTAAPVVTREYTSSPVNSKKGRQYFGKNTTLKIQVQDENIRYKELKDSLLKMTAEDINGTSVKDTKAWTAINGISSYGTKRGTWKVDIPLSTDANYTIPISYTDLAGNRAELNVTELPTKDTTLPTDLELKYSINDPVNYKYFGYLFAQYKMTVTASAKDETAGIHIIRFTIKDEDGRETVKEKEFSPGETKSYKVTVPLKTSDFKGTVKTEVIDWSGNQVERTRSHIIESGSRHESAGKAVITTQTDPSRSVGSEDYYNTDVKLDLEIQDDYSGIGSYSYKLGSADTEKRSYREEAGEELKDDQTMKIVNEVSLKNLTLSADSNNENDVVVSADYTDNAGHEGHTEQLYNIDITAPVITVEYDLNDPSSERFYNQTRTATVTIRERNFDADDVDFTITNTDGAMPSISGWSSSGSGDDTEHVCTVTFSADGDYTFTVAFEDMAGNTADYDRVDEFTIDQTKPELTVTYDNNQNQNEYYYAQSRTATIDILEHNFDPALIDVVTTADGAGAPSVSGWSRNGDHNVATVTFSADADYTFDITGMDQAENPLDEYETDHFVVDQTAPELEIFDIENMSANNGTVMPGIRYYDRNYDANGSVILMRGERSGVQEMNGSKTVTAGGMEIRLDDFAHTPEMDDLYTMEATVYDLAGNSSEASVVFSVNRFGSVYTFDNETDLLVGEGGKYYTKEEQDIVVTETNVDTLEFKEITCNLNGNLRTMAEGEDYTVKVSGSDVSWKQYTYTIAKHNFEEEGTYLLTIYSEDRASNTSDNNTKGRKIEFVVDKTKPSVVISGVENGGQYRENSREVTLDVQDNVRMAEVEVTVDGAKTTYTASQVAKMDGKITFMIGSANHWQTLSVRAYDAAGNISEQEKEEEISFLITSNIFVQFFMNKILFCSTLAIVLILGAGIWWFLILGKKKKEEEEK